MGTYTAVSSQFISINKQKWLTHSFTVCILLEFALEVYVLIVLI